jgi:sugar phosphate isomerase/epimerase
MFLGYNTNGMAHHDLFDAVELLAEIGYRGVAITIDHNALPPHGRHVRQRIARLRRLLERLGMRSVIETGARFLLDPRLKHEPTLLSEGRRVRIDFYKYAVDCAAQLGSDCVSLWSGALRGKEAGSGPFFGGKTHFASKRLAENMDLSPSTAHRQALDRLVEGLREVLDYAAAKDVAIGFEPEPGMLIDSLRAFEELLGRIDAPNLGLTLDVGHLQCQGETPIPEMIRRWAPRLVNVHLDDMRTGVHQHLMFGDGEIEFPPILQTLTEVGYTGGVYVELSGHSRQAPEAAKEALEFLSQRMREGPSVREKGDSPHLPERPEGCCAQMGTVPFFLPRSYKLS